MRAAKILAVLTVLFMWGCGVEWFPDDRTTNGGGFNNNSTAGQFNNFSAIFRNISTASQSVSDSTGTVTVKSVVANESSRTTTDVKFTLYVDVYNAGSTAATVEMELAAVDSNGQTVFAVTESCLVDAGARKSPGYTGLKVTIAQWNSITKWKALKVTKK